MDDSLPRQLAGSGRANHIGRNDTGPLDSFQRRRPVVEPLRGARPRAQRIVEGLPAGTYEIASGPRSRSVIWDTSSTTKSTP